MTMRLSSPLLLTSLLFASASSGVSAESNIRGNRDLQTPDFTIDLRNALCPDLSEINRNNAADATSCAALCASDPDCDLWQYCPPDNSCPLFNDVWTPGNWARCYISTSTSSRESCVPDRYNRWIGAARSGSSRVPSKSSPVDSKRGFSGYLTVDLLDGTTLNPTCHDAAALNLENSWYYNWQPKTSSGDYCRNDRRLWGAGPNGDGTQMGWEFVPMLIGVGQAANQLSKIDDIKAEWTRANVHFLLGYNEPDPSPNHPHAVDAATAAADWPLVQQVAASFDPPLRLVSPAPASEDFDEDGVSTWLEDFFGNCTEVVDDCDPSLIEFIAFHDYKGDVGMLERRINGMAAHYGRPLWLTEYSIGRWNPSPLRPEQEDYMRESLALLENHPSIFRYVWFHSRDSPGRWGGVKDLLKWNVSEPTITTTGEIYRDFPQGPSTSAPTQAPPPLYEPEPGLFLLLSWAGESCTSACLRSGMFCTYDSLASAAPYGTSVGIETTAAELGLPCNKNKGDRNGKAFPQIRPDLANCFGKAEPAKNYDCDAASTWNVLGQRICSCIGSTGGEFGDECVHSSECVSGSCHVSGTCE